MEEPEQEREAGTESPKGCGARGAAPRRLFSRPASPKGPRQSGQGRFTGTLRGLPPPPLGPPARPRPPPPAVAATASPSPPRPLELSLRAASDQRPPRTRLSTANGRPGPDTSHAAELEADASPTSLSARPTPSSARATPPPLTKLPSDSTTALPTRVPPTCWRSNRKSCYPRPSAFEWAAPPAARAASAHGHLGVVVLLPEPLFLLLRTGGFDSRILEYHFSAPD